jgi:hypothetical protein
MAGSQVPTSITILNSLKGFQALSLTEYTTSAAAAIAAGSIVEIAGAFFQFAADETPTGWTSIATGSTAYIALTASGTAGSQIVEASYTATAPTWRDDHQGWYASAASSVRVIGSVYKAEATNYGPKYIYNPKSPDTYRQSGKQVFTSSGVFHVPLTVSQVYLTGCAAGGNGGDGVDGNYAGGGGGGGGEIVLNKAFSVTPGSSVVVTIGSVGANTSFGAVSFNCGNNGSNGLGAIGGAGGTGGALGNGVVAGASGGRGGNSTETGITGSTSGFAEGGGGGAPLSFVSGGGGGGGGLGSFAYYSAPSAGGGGSVTGGAMGSHGGGGGGGGAGNGVSGGSGGRGGYGSGGGGGGANYNAGVGGVGGSGGSAILIVEW